jgi:hypothetical protein
MGPIRSWCNPNADTSIVTVNFFHNYVESTYPTLPEKLTLPLPLVVCSRIKKVVLAREGKATFLPYQDQLFNPVTPRITCGSLAGLGMASEF